MGTRGRRGAAGLWLSAALLAVAGCARGPAPGAPPPSATATPAPRHDGLNATLWLQSAAEYRASVLQAFHAASAHLDRALADPTWSAAIEQEGDPSALPPAIILDMDEAIIRSDRFQAQLVREGRGFTLKEWQAWVRSETAEAMPGALEYVRHARARGVAIFYVTNRTAEVEQATFDNLRKLGFPVEGGLDALLTQGERPDWPADKSSRRAFLARSHRILQIVGDNLNDFVSGARTEPAARRALADAYAGWWGVRWIIMPNPAYGGWYGALFDFDYRLPVEERRRRMFDQLRTWK